MAGKLRELALQLFDARFQQPHFLEQQLHWRAQHGRYARLFVGEVTPNLCQACLRPLRHDQSEFTTKPAQCVDAPRAGTHPRRARAVQCLQCLLLDALDRHRLMSLARAASSNARASAASVLLRFT